MSSRIVKEEGSSESWDNIWEDFDDKNQTHRVLFTTEEPQTIYQLWQRAYFEDLWHLIKDRNYSKFLELGSGRGTTSLYLADSGVEDITLVDLSKHAFKIAEDEFRRRRFKVPKMVMADVEQTNLPGATYDCIYNIGLLEHFNDPFPTLQESFRLLRQGGMIFMPIIPALPYTNGTLQRLLFNPLGHIKLALYNTLRPDHKQSADSNMIRTTTNKSDYLEMVHRAGFTNVSCLPYNPYWKVNRDGAFERNVTLKAYKRHLANRRKKERYPLLETSDRYESAYLLIGHKE